jgi:hypothetical protein
MILLFLRRSSLNGDSWSIAMAAAHFPRKKKRGFLCRWGLGGIEEQSRAGGWCAWKGSGGANDIWTDGQVLEEVADDDGGEEEGFRRGMGMGMGGVSVSGCACLVLIAPKSVVHPGRTKPNQTKSSSPSSLRPS